MIKYFDINQPGYSVKCKLFCEQPREIDNCIIFFHGFGGHKDNKAAERFAENVHSKMKRTAVLAFDWPGHGKDVRRKFNLEDCITYMQIVLDYASSQIHADRLFAYGTSFGAFMVLKYLHEKGNPFLRIALRCPAVTMYESMSGRIMTQENKVLLEKGKEAMIGFDRKVKIDREFIEELKESDIFSYDYIDYADSILILQGDRDEIVSPEKVREFADNNVIECIVMEGADHRFQDLDLLKLAHSYMINFFLEAV